MAAPRTLPQPRPRLANRQQFVTDDGEQIDLLVAADNSTCYRFVRSLANALMGKVKSAVLCEADVASGTWVVPTPFTTVAIKQLYKVCVERGVTTDGKPVRENPLGEVAMMHYLSEPGHGNVMRLVDFLHDDRCYYVVLEMLGGGELFDQVHELGKVPEASARQYMWDVLQGVGYIHSRHITHRDLSLENAMREARDPAATVKLIDFGLAVVMPEGYGPLKADGRGESHGSLRFLAPRQCAVTHAPPTAAVRTPPPSFLLARHLCAVGKEKYMAPETYALVPYDGRAIDVWCCGMMLFVLLFGIYPYSVPSPASCPYFKEIAAGKLVALLRSWGMAAAVSPEALDLVNRMLTVDVRHRITVADALVHPWFTGAAAAAAVGGPPGAGGGGSVGGGAGSGGVSGSVSTGARGPGYRGGGGGGSGGGGDDEMRGR